MKSKDKRKQRRQAVQIEQEVSVKSEEIVSLVEKTQHIEHPCPVCGISEMRNVVGGAKICPLCEAEKRKQNATAKSGLRQQRSNVLADYVARYVRRWIYS